MLQSMRGGAQSKFIKFIFFGLLIMAGLGLIMTDMGGFFRSGPPLHVAFEVDGDSFSTVELDRMVSQRLRQQNISLEEGIRQGIIESIINEQVDARILAKETQRMGIRVSDSIVAQKVNEFMDNIMGMFGNQPVSKKTLFRQFVNNMGMTEGQYVQTEKVKIASDLLTNALTETSVTPKLIDKYLVAFDNEKRVPETYMVRVKDAPSPTDEELQAYYDQNKQDYATPEYRRFSMAVLEFDQISKEISISEDTLKDEYEARLGEFTVPERRLIAQALIDTKEQADEIAKLAKEKGDLQTALKEVLGSTDNFIEAEEYTRTDLPEELADAAFALNKGTYSAPIETSLGWYVVHVKEIAKGKTTPFNDVKASIKKDLQEQEASDLLFEVANTLEDALAGGALLSEAANELNLPVVEWSFIDNTGKAQKSGGKDLDDKAVLGSTDVLNAVFEANEGESSPLIENDKGDFVIVQTDEVIPSTVPALNDIKKTVANDWKENKKQEVAREKAAEYVTALSNDETPVSLKKHRAVSRNSDGRKDFDEVATIALFQLEKEGDITSIPTEDGYLIIRLKDIQLSVKDSVKTDTDVDPAVAFKQDLLNRYYNHLKGQVDVEINHDVIERLYQARLGQ